ncbi:MAG: FecR family protein [Spirochaetota bacterium]
MKKIIITIISLSLLFLFSCKEKQEVIKLEGIVNFVSGEVLLKTTNGEFQARVGDFVAEGITVKTGAKSAVDIYFNQNVIRILENSAVSIHELFQEAGTGKEFTEFYVENGKVFSKVSRKLVSGEKYQITTKTTVAGVRGTEFFVEESEDVSRIACIEGTVAVKKADEDDSKFINLEAGNEAVLDENKEFDLRELEGQNKENIQKIRDEIKEMRKDIRDKFDKQREKIRKEVSDLKDATKEKVAEQKILDKENVKAAKEASKAKVSEMRGSIDDKKSEAKTAVDKFEKPDIKGVKPDIKKLGQ